MKRSSLHWRLGQGLAVAQKGEGDASCLCDLSQRQLACSPPTALNLVEVLDRQSGGSGEVSLPQPGPSPGLNDSPAYLLVDHMSTVHQGSMVVNGSTRNLLSASLLLSEGQ